jgi:peptide/nickel transport system ATP-binding protein
LLHLRDVSARYNLLDSYANAVDSVTFTVGDNEIFGIAGESGCGKSTLLKVMYDLVRYPLEISAGRAEIETRGADGEKLLIPTGEIRNVWWKSISYVPQGAMHVMNPVSKVKYQFFDTIGKHRKTGSRRLLAEEIADYLRELELAPEVLDAYPHQLSGGMRQRVLIALATFLSPSIILADEPTTALDVIVQRSILTMFKRVQRKAGNSMVIVSHDMGVHYQIANRMGIMYAGQMVEIGPTDEIFERPRHPYTQMLIAALPRIGDNSQKEGIPGKPPSLMEPPPGCRFAERCLFAKPECRRAQPAMVSVGENHSAACFRLDAEGRDGAGLWGAGVADGNAAPARDGGGRVAGKGGGGRVAETAAGGQPGGQSGGRPGRQSGGQADGQSSGRAGERTGSPPAGQTRDQPGGRPGDGDSGAYGGKALEIRGLSKQFRIGGMIFGTKIMAAEDVNISMPADRPWILSIVGESGSGKTTLARMILKLVEPSGGDILLKGEPIMALGKDRPKEYYKRVQPIFQNPFSAFSPRKTVDTYLYETALNLDMAASRAEAGRMIGETLSAVGLDRDAVFGKYPNQFSGGELQRVSIARALLTKPDIIVADEPVAMIDASLRMNVVNLFKQLKTAYGVNFIYITHDLSTAYYVSDYIATMYRGNIIEFGRAEAVLENPLHPYTQLLLDSIPKVGLRWNDDMALPDIESREYQLAGCKFAGRCAFAADSCRSSKPAMREAQEGHWALCFKYSGEPRKPGGEV